MSNELEAFVDSDTMSVSAERTQIELDVLVIEQGKVQLGILASAVDSVIPWQQPEPLPQSSPHVLGVIQDRGRLVAVHRHPELDQPVKRLAVCTTRLGLIGIAATETRHVGAISFDGEVQLNTPLRTSAGDLTFVDPERLAAAMVGGDATPPHADT